MKKAFILSLCCLFITLTWTACKHEDEKFISEGSIEFSATVVDKSNSMASMAPSKMTIRFKKNKSCVEMSAGMGLFNTQFVSNPETHTLLQLVKLLNKKFWLMEDEAQLKKEIEDYKIEIKPTNETKIIAGYNCKKSVVHYTDDSSPDFDIYYTNELNIQNPNFANPFHTVDGVLMEYQMKKFGLEMKFEAKKVTKETIEDATFQVPDDYKKISQKEMNELFGSLE